jgi:hypothetical protein
MPHRILMRLGIGYDAARKLLSTFMLWLAGTTTGGEVATLIDWKSPRIIAGLVSALVMLALALIRQFFREREYTMETLKGQIKEQAGFYNRQLSEAQIQRHELANKAHRGELLVMLISLGLPHAQLQEAIQKAQTSEIYDVEKERQRALEELEISIAPNA